MAGLSVGESTIQYPISSPADLLLWQRPSHLDLLLSHIFLSLSGRLHPAVLPRPLRRGLPQRSLEQGLQGALEGVHEECLST